MIPNKTPKRRSTDELHKTEKHLFSVANIALFFGAVIGLLAYHNHWLDFLHASLQLLIKEISFAVIVAIVLIYTIERVSRAKHQHAADELIEKINVDLFHAIYKRSIPYDVFGEVEKCLLKQTVYRTEYDVTYILRTMVEPGCHDFVKCESRSSYDLTNITDTTIEHDVNFFVELPLDSRMMQFCSINRVEIGDEVLIDGKLDELVTKTAAQLKFTKKVVLQPRATISVNTSATLIKRRIDEEIWRSVLPSSGFKLTVVTPEKNLDLQAIAFHSQELKSLVSEGDICKWELDYGMLPHQAVLFWWKPKELANAAVECSPKIPGQEVVGPKDSGAPADNQSRAA